MVGNVFGKVWFVYRDVHCTWVDQTWSGCPAYGFFHLCVNRNDYGHPRLSFLFCLVLT